MTINKSTVYSASLLSFSAKQNFSSSFALFMCWLSNFSIRRVIVARDELTNIKNNLYFRTNLLLTFPYELPIGNRFAFFSQQ